MNITFTKNMIVLSRPGIHPIFSFSPCPSLLDLTPPHLATHFLLGPVTLHLAPLFLSQPNTVFTYCHPSSTQLHSLIHTLSLTASSFSPTPSSLSLPTTPSPTTFLIRPIPFFNQSHRFSLSLFDLTNNIENMLEIFEDCQRSNWH